MISSIYSHTSLQITLMAKAQLHAQVFCHIPDPRIKLLVWEVEPKVCPNTALGRFWRLTFLSFFTSSSPRKSKDRTNSSSELQGRHPVLPTVYPGRWKERGPAKSLDTTASQGFLDVSFHFEWMYNDGATHPKKIDGLNIGGPGFRPSPQCFYLFIWHNQYFYSAHFFFSSNQEIGNFFKKIKFLAVLEKTDLT